MIACLFWFEALSQLSVTLDSEVLERKAGKVIRLQLLRVMLMLFSWFNLSSTQLDTIYWMWSSGSFQMR